MPPAGRDRAPLGAPVSLSRWRLGGLHRVSHTGFASHRARQRLSQAGGEVAGADTREALAALAARAEPASGPRDYALLEDRMRADQVSGNSGLRSTVREFTYGFGVR